MSKPRIDSDEPAKMECPKCGCNHFVGNTEVANTIPTKDGIKRRRKCRHCGRPIQTREIPESLFQQLNRPKAN